VLLSLSLLGETHASAGGAKVYVFAVTTARPRSLATDMETAMPGVTVTVFGRIGDFQRSIGAEPADALIAPSPVLAGLGKKADLVGSLKGAATEPYLVLSSKQITVGDLGGKTIGILDMLGRSELPKFVQKTLGLSATPNVSRVTKIEDLLPLLQFDTADAILLPERFLGEFKAKSKIQFNVLRVPSAQVGCASVAFTGNRGAVEGAIRNLPGNVKSQLGIDGWK
jgi:hypothetical protein